VAAPAETRTPNVHRANESLLESANGSMATVVTRQEVNRLEQRTDLTPAGLLMEGDSTSVRFSFAFWRHYECNGDFSPLEH